MIKIRITWPVIFLLLVALLVWLVRDPEQPNRRARSHSRKRRRPPLVSRDLGAARDGQRRDPAGVTYGEAIRAPHGTYTEDEIEGITQREIFEAAGEAFYSATPITPNPLLTRIPAWRSSDDDNTTH